MAIQTLLALSAEDAVLLQRLIDRVRRDPPRTGSTPGEGEDYLTPEVYLAKAPAGGLPAADAGAFGQATCDLYRAGADGVLTSTGLTKLLLNPGSAVAADATVLAVRDKFGTWLALPVSGGGLTLDVVTQVCPVTTGSAAGVRVERRTLTLPAGTLVGDPVCTDDPQDCCPAEPPPAAGPGCCPGVSIPATLYLTVTAAECPCLAGTVPLTWDGSHWRSGDLSGCPGYVVRWDFYCDLVGLQYVWLLRGYCSESLIFSVQVNAADASCSPLSVTFDGTYAFVPGCCTAYGSAIQGVVTE